MKIIAELNIIPIGIGTSLSKYIAECERILQSANLKIELHAEGTDIEGEYNDVVKAVKECIETLHRMGVQRVTASLRLSSRTDKNESMASRIESVEAQLE